MCELTKSAHLNVMLPSIIICTISASLYGSFIAPFIIVQICLSSENDVFEKKSFSTTSI